MKKNGKSNGAQAPAPGGPRHIQVSEKHMRPLRKIAAEYKALALRALDAELFLDAAKARARELAAAMTNERNALARAYNLDEAGPGQWGLDDETGRFTRQDAAPPAPAAAPPPAAPKPEAAAP